MLQSAIAGHGTAMCNVGVYYRDGIGCAKDYSIALQWFKHAIASSNESDAENCLGYHVHSTLFYPLSPSLFAMTFIDMLTNAPKE
jgi:TPR repeat protein